MPKSVKELLNAVVNEGYETTPEEDALIAATLTPLEEKWRDRHGMFKAEGYEFRPRLRPGWKPSWLESGAHPFDCEDGELLPLRIMLVDAIHEATGKAVYIKEVGADSEELRIIELLTQDDWLNDSRNHCVPVKKVFRDHQDPGIAYIVMPLMRPVDNPPFETVKEIIRFTDQILEGLVFLHEKGVAHRDCVQKNLVMDAEVMYPEGFHPVAIEYNPDRTKDAKYISRTAAKVKYFFIDFGISVYIPEDLRPKMVTGFLGRDRDPPELSKDVPYDPFKLDIFIIGNMFKRDFQEPFSNLDFFKPLVDRMTQADPSSRPDAKAALEQWQGIRKSISALHRKWRPREREEYCLEAFVLDAINLHQLFMSCARSFVKRMRPKASS